MREKISYRILLAGTALWCVAILAPPFFPWESFPTLSLLVKKFFSPVCHQISERSLHVFDIPFAVCARCSAMYFSFFFGIIFWKKLSSFSFFSFPNVFLFFSPLILDVLFNISGVSEQFSFLHNTYLLRRIITGTLVGFSLGVAFVPLFFAAIKEIPFFNSQILLDYESQTK